MSEMKIPFNGSIFRQDFYNSIDLKEISDTPNKAFEKDLTIY